ncbi:acyl-CoA carboxylase subunit epsilon [Streptomyces sp. cmx-4-9]|uniref:acyl-CoA carboxylase subunit epsilon n=1 Tax=Streptomyces sp. cmx-4-9 TaxID=2790941 RepID=UPI00397EDC07
MSDADTGMLALRIERGRAEDDELAAVTVVLCSLLAARGADEDDGELPGSPSWRPERSAAAYRSPYSWQ